MAPRARVGRRLRLDVTVTDDLGRRSPHAALGPWLARAAPARAKGRVAIAIVNDAAMRRLNRRFRGVPRATDVLAFPAESGGLPGDIAISRDMAVRQARREGHALATELRILALHGLLHLFGYDHDTDHGEMRRAEDRLRRRAGLPAGLIARAPGRRARP